MTPPLSRRSLLQGAAATVALAALPPAAPEAPAAPLLGGGSKMSGAAALVEALKGEGVLCVYGIPGAQQNELWDEMKSRCLPYLLVTHELSAAGMADGYARSTGQPGVLCVVPGPGITNAITGIGEALLDSVPMVVVAGDVAQGEKYKAFQVHSLANVALLQPVCKGVFPVSSVSEIPAAVRQELCLARSGEPGPAAVVVPYHLLNQVCPVQCLLPAPRELPFDEAAFQNALALLSWPGNPKKPCQVGIYAGMGCMDHCQALVQVAELLQAPVATSVSGKGVIDELHPLAVGWGYGPQGTCTAEQTFKHVDIVLAIGVRYSEVSTAYYSIPQHKCVIHVDANQHNLGKVLKTSVCVHADSGLFLARLLENADQVRRPANPALVECIQKGKTQDACCHEKIYARCGVDPMAFLLALRRATPPETLVFVDVTLTEHLAAEAFTVCQPRTYFNPTDNQSMGWSIPAAIGAQRVHPGRLCVTVTGDGCFLMSGIETSTAARECLPVKFFVLDDQAYHYMQVLQNAAYKRTTATHLARLDYAALAKGFGLGYVLIDSPAGLEGGIKAALECPGPVLVQVAIDYCDRKIRWINAARSRYFMDLCTDQKVRLVARLGGRSLHGHPHND